MGREFTLRVDLESNKGIKEGLPKLLDLLKKCNIKVSFYLVMGGESNIFELLKYRGKMTSSSERGIKIWSLKDKIRMALFPRDFVKRNMRVLRRILEEGHELGLHGWKHRAWTRGGNKVDIEKHVASAVRRYRLIFNRNPTSFCAPGFSTNEKVLEILEEYGIKFVSDFEGDKPKFYGKIKNVPITICGEKRTPVIEYMVSLGKSDAEILDYMKETMKRRELSSFYIHDLFEARFKLRLLEEIFKFIKKEKIKPMRIMDF